MTTQIVHNPHTVYVYVARFDDGVCVRDVLPASRNAYIASAVNSRVRAQRYCVWRLLDFALTQCTGKSTADYSLVRCDDGLWRCADNGVYFSLSHSGNTVAAALSDIPVGVDVELYRAERFTDRLARRIASDDELRAYSLCAPCESNRFVAEMWARRESAFKYYRNCACDGSLQSSAPAPDTCCRWINVGGEQFVLSVAALPDSANATRGANTSPVPDTLGANVNAAVRTGNYCCSSHDYLPLAPDFCVTAVSTAHNPHAAGESAVISEQNCNFGSRCPQSAFDTECKGSLFAQSASAKNNVTPSSCTSDTLQMNGTTVIFAQVALKF